VDGAPVKVCARTHPAHDSAKLANVLKRAERSPDHPLGVDGLLLDGLGIAVYAYPNDRRLPVLRDLADPARRGRLLSRVVPGDRPLHGARLECLRYKPERRFVGRLRAAGAQAVLKAYTPPGWARALAGSEAVAAADGLRVAPLLGRSQRDAVLVFGWLDGSGLDAALRAKRASVENLRSAGGALARLHAIVVEVTSGQARRMTSPHTAARTLAAVLGEQAGSDALALADQLAAGAPRPAAAPARLVHGDFSCDQVLLGRDGAEPPAIVDLDESGPGDPAMDLGSFVADLELRMLRGEITGAGATDARSRVAAGYADGGGADSTVARGLGPGAAAALLARAVEPFRRREAEWASLAMAALRRAGELA